MKLTEKMNNIYYQKITPWQTMQPMARTSVTAFYVAQNALSQDKQDTARRKDLEVPYGNCTAF